MRRRLTVLLPLVVAGAAAAIPGAGAAPASGPAARAAASGFETPGSFAGPVGRVALGGRWGYRADPRNAGLRARWQGRRSGAGYRSMRIPYVPNASTVTGKAGTRNHEGSVGWYRREIEMPVSGLYRIRFGSVNHRASIWLDGRRLGTHTGAYEAFEFDARLRAGRRHVLLLRADWRDPRRMKLEGYHRGWFNWGGVGREVTIRRIGDSDLDEPSLQTTLASAGGRIGAVVDVAVRLHNNAGARVLAPTGEFARGNQTYRFAFPPTTVVQGGSTVVRQRVVVADPALWSPSSPALYDLRLTVPGEAAYQARVGLRQLGVVNGRPILNGRPLYLYGASVHEDAPGRGDGLRGPDQDRIVRMLRAIGANATRVMHPLDPGLLERLDAAGILLWQHVGPWDSPGNWFSTTAAKRARARARVLAALKDDQLHPSIAVWSLANEVAGNGHSGGQAGYIDQTAQELHARDPGRLVGVDIWGKHLPGAPGTLYRHLDVVGETNYIGWYEYTFASPEELRTAIFRRSGALHDLFPSKAIFVTEFGAEANRLNRGSRHGSFGYQAKLIERHLGAYHQLPYVSGILIWNLRDFALTPSFAGGSIVRRVRGIRLVPGINQKGLFDYRGRPKPSVAVARGQFDAFRASSPYGP